MIDKSIKIICGIVTYNPDIKRFSECVKSLESELRDLLIYDNASSNINDIKNVINESTLKHEIKTADKNQGIATGLKYIMNYAINNSYDYVLTLDQDSIIQKGLIDKYLEYIDNSETGALTCIIKERETDGLYNIVELKEIEECNFAITSGFFIKVSAYKKISGYDEKLFIDNVDFDLCCQLRKAGFKIYKIPYYGVYHEIGHSQNKKILGKVVSSYMHDAKRKYYIGRNTIYELRKFPEYYSFIMQYKFIIKLILKIIILEDNKIEKIKSLIKGINDGYRIEITK